MLKGKTGRFRQNLLGKRVDYSGRSVIVVGPDLKFHQCGLPKKMALELFKPFIMKQLVEDGIVHNIKSAKKYVERLNSNVWDILDKVIKDHPVLLNRAPTLHRLGIQAFEPVLVEGKAIKLHPLVCTAYNADFDGDQMAVHLPLSTEAQAEARLLMLSTNNILAPKDGKPITTPTQDMVLGSYYLTSGTVEEQALRSFMDYDEMFKAYSTNNVKIHDTVNVLYRDEETGESQIVKSTVGRFIFNEHLPQDLGFVDRNKDKYSLEVDRLVDKKMLGKIVDKCFRKHGNIKTAEVLDYIKSTGYKYSTVGAISISMNDVIVPEEKWEILKEAEQKIAVYEELFRDGLVSEQERYEYVISVWTKATEDITKILVEKQDPTNSISIMADSGARGNINQIRQLAGMRGLMSSATGRIVEIPIKANFREGLSVQEFFISTHGSRKGLSDTALRTADSGYLTRRLVDVSQDVIVREDDCCTDEYVLATDFKDGNAIVEKLADRIVGRHSFEDVLNPTTGEILIHKNEMITESLAEKVEKLGITEIKVRSVLGCKSKHGVCAKCYGRNLATGNPVNIGEAVGIIAAQSIGEPGTQLTMRTFHSGGVAGVGITQGLPRVEELFEARKPKGLAYITEIDGTVKLVDNKKRYDIVVTADDGDERIYAIPYGARIKVKDGEEIKAGDMLTEGSINPHDILAIKGPTGVQEYITKEVQKVYRNQGVDIDDRHIEIIIKQMLSKVKIDTSGDTNFLEGSLVPFREVEAVNGKMLEEDKMPATFDNVLLGITKASLATESFLSAASFQETTRVLTDASIKGKADGLIGLKENVILGKLIPAGTGMKVYKSIEIDYETLEEEERLAREETLEHSDSEEIQEVDDSIEEELEEKTETEVETEEVEIVEKVEE